MSIRKAIRQIEALTPNRPYAIVFNERLTQKELSELKEICEKANIRALLLTDARVVPLDQVFALVGATTEGEIERAKELKSKIEQAKELNGWDGKPLPPGAMASADVPLDVTEVASV